MESANNSRATENPRAGTERAKLLRAGTLHWFHWFVVALSICLTFGAWWFSTTQIQEKVRTQFERETEQVIELIAERMQKYEDGLWGGVGAMAIRNGRLSSQEWKTFARTLSIDVKYPGINGIGVIDHVGPSEFDSYLERQHQDRPDFKIYPPHQQSEYLPISYIEPAETNYQAIGLDMAHEKNRYAAAMRARDTGQAQITAPIVLVQDTEKNPGFLFYAPFYSDTAPDTIDERRKTFSGMVYAPFMVKKLMEGVLAKQKRRVGIRITDGITLYDEHFKNESDFDPSPLFKQNQFLQLYGRTWNFDIWSGMSFRSTAENGQPIAILVGGLLIDGMLFILFILLSRANRNALQYADMVTADLDRSYQSEQRAREILEKAQLTLKQQTEKLKISNRELQDFASVAAHDLQEPLRKIQSFGDRIEKTFGDELPEQARLYFSRMRSSARRMSILISDILSFSRVRTQETKFESINLQMVMQDVVDELKEKFEEVGGNIEFNELGQIDGNESQIRQLFHNLLWNSIKYRRSEVPLEIRVTGRSQSEGQSIASNGETCKLEFSDNGIGFEEKYSEKIFTIFQRLHGQSAYEGTGIGLALCRKIIEHHGGTIVAHGIPDGIPGSGATFTITLPTAQPHKAAA